MAEKTVRERYLRSDRARIDGRSRLAMRKRTRNWLSIALLLLVVAGTACANVPLVSGQVLIDNGTTRYIYTITNILSSDQIRGFYDLPFPKELALSHSEPVGWSYHQEAEISGGRFFWVSDAQSMVQPGQSAVFEVYTSYPVVTRWIQDWNVGALDAGGREYFFNDGAALPAPAPVPEPSSILALVSGIAGLGGFVLRRRKV